MVGATTHIKHETKAGELNIVLNLGQENEIAHNAPTDVPLAHPPGGCTPDQTMIRLTFEDGQTGAFYDAAFTHAELVKICTVFHMTDEIPDIFADAPEIMQDVVGPNWPGACPHAAGFKYRTGKGRMYQIILPMYPRMYPAETRDLVELRAENSVLRKKVATLEERVAKLEKMCMKISSLDRMCDTHRTDISCIAKHLMFCHMNDEGEHKFTVEYPRMIIDISLLGKIQFSATFKSDRMMCELLEYIPMDDFMSGETHILFDVINNHSSMTPEALDRARFMMSKMANINVTRKSDGMTILGFVDQKIEGHRGWIRCHGQTNPGPAADIQKQIDELMKFRNFAVGKGLE